MSELTSLALKTVFARVKRATLHESIAIEKDINTVLYVNKIDTIQLISATFPHGAKTVTQAPAEYIK